MSGTTAGLTDWDLDKGLIEAKSAAAFTERAYKEFMSFRDAKYLLTITASSPETVEEWLDRIHLLEEKALNMGEYIPTPDGEFRAMEFWDFRRAQGRFVDHMSVDFNARINSISDIGRMAVFTVDKHLYNPFYDFNPQSLVYAFRHRREGILATVSGTMGVGKTDFALLITEQLLASEKPVFNVITNIWLTPKTLEAYEGRLYYENTMRGLLRTLCLKARDPTRHAVVPLDETSMFFSRREPGKKTNVLLEKFIRLIRKYNASLIFIDQQKDGLPGPALELRTVMYHKTDLTKVHYSSALGARNYNHYLSHVPKTSLGYDTKRVGFFDYNMDLEALFKFNDVQEQEGIDAIESTTMFLDNLDMQPVRDPFDVRALKYIEDNDGCTRKDLQRGLGLPDEDAARKRVDRLIIRFEGDRLIDREKDGVLYRLHRCPDVHNN